MANIKSKVKRIKTNEKAHVRNVAVKSELKTNIKRVREAIANNDKDQAQNLMKIVVRKLDKAAAKGIIHKKQASNRKSKLQSTINSVK